MVLLVREGVDAKFTLWRMVRKDGGYVRGLDGLCRAGDHVRVDVVVLVQHGVVFWVLVAVLGGGSGGPWLSSLLSSYFFCCEETTTGAAGTAHGVFVAGLVEVRLVTSSEVG